MTSLTAITPREASIFACVCDTVVAPEPVLPPVRQTDAALFFDRWMARSPRLNRLGLRALLHAIELAPFGAGFGGRLRALPAEERTAFMDRVEHLAPVQLRPLVKLVKGMAFLAYYGDGAVMLRVGYDAEERVRRGRDLRALESRP